MARWTSPFTLLRQAREATIHSLPGPRGDRLRHDHWKQRLGSLGDSVRISEGAFFTHPEEVHISDGAWIDRNVLVLAGAPRADRITHRKPVEGFPGREGQVTIGRATHIAPNCVLSGIGGLHIGDACGVASNSTLYSFSHHYRNLVDRSDTRQYSFTPRAPPEEQSMLSSPVYVEDQCAVGLNSVLLPGTHLHPGTWVASGSVVKGVWGPQATVRDSAELAGQEIQGLTLIES